MHSVDCGLCRYANDLEDFSMLPVLSPCVVHSSVEETKRNAV